MYLKDLISHIFNKMWTYLNVGNYLVHLNVGNSEFRIACTDLIKTWKAEISLDDVIKRFRELNPRFDIEDASIIEKTKDLYTKDGVTHIVVPRLGVAQSPSFQPLDQLIVTSSATIGPYNYSFEILMTAADNEMLFEKLTKPVLCMLKSMHDRELKLIEIIREKDVEIEQYKEEGAELKRKGVITAPFSHEDLKSNSIPDQEIFKCPASVIRGPLHQRLSEFMPKDSTVAVKEEKSSPPSKPKRMYTDLPAGPSISMLSSGIAPSKKPKHSSRLRL